MKTNLAIHKLDQKTIKSGPNEGNPYWVAKTEKGDHSIFDADTAKAIKADGLGHVCEVEVQETHKGDKTYRNITGLYDVHGKAEPMPEESKNERFEESSKLKQASVMISYAKDLAIAKMEALSRFCESNTECMELIGTLEESIHEQAKGFMALQKELTK